MKRFENSPFALIGVNSDKNRDRIRTIVDELDLPWRNFWDGGTTGSPIHQQWQVYSSPTLYVLDAKGIIRYKDVFGSELDSAIIALLKEMNEKIPPELKADDSGTEEGESE